MAKFTGFCDVSIWSGKELIATVPNVQFVDGENAHSVWFAPFTRNVTITKCTMGGIPANLGRRHGIAVQMGDTACFYAGNLGFTVKR